MFSSSQLMSSSNTLALYEQLRQVLGFAIGLGPLPVLDLESGYFFLAFFFSGRLLFHLLAIFVQSSFHFDNFGLWEDFVLDFVFFDVLLLRVELEANNGLDFTNMLLNTEKLIHVSQFVSIIIKDQFARIAEPFNKYIFLGPASNLIDGMLNNLNNQIEVKVHG